MGFTFKTVNSLNKEFCANAWSIEILRGVLWEENIQFLLGKSFWWKSHPEYKPYLNPIGCKKVPKKFSKNFTEYVSPIECRILSTAITNFLKRKEQSYILGIPHTKYVEVAKKYAKKHVMSLDEKREIKWFRLFCWQAERLGGFLVI